MKNMLADYMENGFLDNIIDMFKHDKSLFSFLPHLMADERGRVRMGTAALVETLKDDFNEEFIKAIPDIASLLKSQNPTIRADAAYLLQVIGHRDGLPYLKEALNDANPLVRETISEAAVLLSALSE